MKINLSKLFRTKEFWIKVLSDPRLWFSISVICILELVRILEEVKIRALADLIRGIANFAWPFLVAMFIYYFRNEISELIKRTRKVGPAGAEFVDAALASQMANRPFDEIKKDFQRAGVQGTVVMNTIKSIAENMDKEAGDLVKDREIWLLNKLANPI